MKSELDIDMFEATREALRMLGLPAGDYSCPEVSNKKFSDGSDFKIEIPSVNSIDTMNAVLRESERLGIRVNRITETYGLFRHTSFEIKEMVALSHEYGCELVMSTGPRASYDTSATASSEQGKTIAYRLRGQEQIVRAIEDIKRAIDFNVKSFLIYDEGLLWILSQMRAKAILPKEIKFKISAHCGHGNPASFKILESLGANSINPVRDLTLPMLSTLRKSVNIPIDCHTDNPPSSGGFIRIYEAPDMVRFLSPIYLKTGNSVLPAHGRATSARDGVRMARQAYIVLETLQRYYPQAVQSK